MKNYGTITQNIPPDSGLLDGGVYLWRPILESDNENLGITAILSPVVIRGERGLYVELHFQINFH